MSAPAAAASGQSDLVYTDVETISATVERVRATFLTHKTRNVEYRKNQLKSLAYGVRDRSQYLCEALAKDLGRTHNETQVLEIGSVIKELVDLINHLDQWSADQHVWAGLAWATHGTVIKKDPKGTVLVLSAWNYPITLALTPLAAAIAAGNTAILKPSEVAAHTARELTTIVEAYLDPEAYAVVNGGVPETTALLDQRFEHIFYTGSGGVGRIIAQKAAKYLCPVTLELGGKSPVWIDESADMEIAANRVFWGKTINAGQTCIAPDYVLVTPATLSKLIPALRKAADKFYPQKGGAKEAAYYARIVNENHTKRLASVLSDTKGTIVYGGHVDAKNRLFEPTIVTDVTGEDSLMENELFGPILPIVTVPNVDAAIDFINLRDQPLALYVFGNSKVAKKVISLTRSGTAVVGDLLLHFIIDELPFGGTGPSGYGACHGKAGFDTFTHQRALLSAPHRGPLGWIVELLMAARYPPVTLGDLRLLDFLIGKGLRFSRPVNPHSVPPVKVSAVMRRVVEFCTGKPPCKVLTAASP